MNLETNFRKLEEAVYKDGAHIFGVADIRAIKGELFTGSDEIPNDLPYGISIGVKILNEVLNTVQTGPTKIYFHHYRQVNFLLDRIALKISYMIEGLGFRALPIAASQTIDWEKQRGHLSHKLIGHKAGLGWIGRNNLLINPIYGAKARYVSILTDLPIMVGEPLETGCGDCRDCIDSCPCGAIKEDVGDFDVGACYKQLRKFCSERKIGQYICGLCVKACKANKG